MNVTKLAVTIFCASVLGCGGTGTREDTGERTLSTVPAELNDARLLYQRPDGIYIKKLSKPQGMRLVESGTWPRWAPDGLSFAYYDKGSIMHYSLANKSATRLAEASEGRAVAFHPDGESILFTDGKAVRRVDIRTREVSDVLNGPRVMEFDISPDGMHLAVTEKSLGYHVNVYNLKSGEKTRIRKGCSASLSPDGSIVTVNLDGHVELGCFSAESGNQTGVITAPDGVTLDNQFWSNHPDWVAVIIEGDRTDIAAQRVSDNGLYVLTQDGDCDRPDLFIGSD